MKNYEKDSLTWFQVNNIVPLVLSALAVAASFYALSIRVSVLETKMDVLISQNEEILRDSKDLNLRMVSLETLHRNELK